MPGHHPAGWEVLDATRGSRGGTRIAHRRLPLQKRRIDYEKLARSDSTALATTLFHATARQPPRAGILRIRTHHATRTDDGKTDIHAAARYGGCAEGARARSGGTRAEVPGTVRPAGGSAMELAREPGAGATASYRQAERRSLRRRHRLPGFSRTRQERDPGAGAEVSVGGESREHFRSRAHWRRKELRGLRLGAEDLPRWLLRAVHARRGAVPGSGDRARRWEPAQSSI